MVQKYNFFITITIFSILFQFYFIIFNLFMINGFIFQFITNFLLNIYKFSPDIITRTSMYYSNEITIQLQQTFTCYSIIQLNKFEPFNVFSMSIA